MSRKKIFAILSVIYLFTHLIFLTYVPFILDEGPYSLVIEGEISHPTIIPTFLGLPVQWKPPIMFWTYAQIVPFLKNLPIPLEAVYRLPGTFFGLINVLLIFLVFEGLLKDRKQAFLVALLYLTIFLPINVDSRVLTDTMCGTAIFAGIIFYINGLSDRKMFLLGGIATFVAYFIKQTVAATVPVLAVALLFDKDRKKLSDPFFLFSLLAFPIADFAYNFMVGTLPGADTAYIIRNSIFNQLDPYRIGGSLILLFLFSATWLPVSLYGFIRNLRRELMMSVWYCLTIFPLIGGTLMPFYFYPVIPAFSYFALQFVYRDTKSKPKTDAFFWFGFLTIAVIGFLVGAMTQSIFLSTYSFEKTAGEFLAGKENVLIIGPYSPGVFSYKMLEEIRSSGAPLDYGLVILPNSSAESYYPFLSNYSVSRNGVIDNNFSLLFAVSTTFRKATNITHFDYIAIIGNKNVTPGGTLVFDNHLNDSNIRIFHMNQ